MSITIYSKNHCPQCDATKRFLKRKNLEFTELNVDTDESLRQQLIEEGFQATPVVKTNTDSWSGYRPDLLAALVH